jgi:hypothetical protein
MEKTPYLFLEGSTPIEFDRTSLCNFFEEHKETHFIYDTHREHELVMWLKESVWYLNESLKKSNSCFTVIIAGTEHPQNDWGRTRKANIRDFDRVFCITNDNHFIRNQVYKYHTQQPEIYKEKFEPLKQKFDNFMLYLNQKPHPHRCEFMDMMQGTDLLKNSLWSWCTDTKTFDAPWDKEKGYPFKNWKEKINLIEGGEYVQNELGWNQNNNEEDIEENNTYFIQLVSESQISKFFLTEKTIKPLIHGHIFLVDSVSGFHTLLKTKFGFKLYDEVIDYSFDTITDTQKRREGIIKNLENLRKQDWKKIYKKLEKKIKFNQKHLIKVAYDYEYNKGIYDLITKYPDTFEELLKDENKNMFLKPLVDTFFKSKSII